MKQNELLELLKECGALLENDHFVYASGKHGSSYINKHAIYLRPEMANRVAIEIAQRFRHSDVEVVVAPEHGATKLGMLVAINLSHILRETVYSVDAVKVADGFMIKEGQESIVNLRRVLVVDDILTTGKSLKKAVFATNMVGGIAFAACVMVNRGGITARAIDHTMHLDAVASVNLHSWEENYCNLCSKDVPVNTQFGHGEAFLKKQKSWGSEHMMRGLKDME